MKQLRSTARDLRIIFEEALTAAHISESLISHEASEPAAAVKQDMLARDFDVVGLKVAGAIVGYVRREDLLSGECGQNNREFTSGDLIAYSTPLINLLPLLREKPRYFVQHDDQVVGIVMRGDLQKAPVRMLIFGLVTLVEMNLLRTIRQHFPNNSWRQSLSQQRLGKAEELLWDRQNRNEALDLADCLQLGDKFDIVRKNKERLHSLQFSATKLTKLKGKTDSLRNRLAHGNDLVTGSSWEEVIDTVTDLEKLLVQLENSASVGDL
jgi:hypothetical protein